MEIWRNGPSGAKVTKSGCEANSSGSWLRLSAGQRSRAADDFEIVRQAEIVLLDFAGIAEQQRRKTPGQRGLTHALGPGKQQGLRDALLRRSCARARA